MTHWLYPGCQPAITSAKVRPKGSKSAVARQCGYSLTALDARTRSNHAPRRYLGCMEMSYLETEEISDHVVKSAA